VCWVHTVDDRPWCEACLSDLERSSRDRWPLAITFLALSVTVVVAGWRAEARRGGEASAEIWIGVLAGAVIIAGVIALRGRRRAHGRMVRFRRDDEIPLLRPEDRGGHPYQAGLRRMARIVAPPLSGRAAALVMGLCLGVTAAAIPMAMDLPRWIEYELALGTWWLLWTVALTTLLYRGWRLSDDLVLRAPRLPFSNPGDRTAGAAAKSTSEGGFRAQGCGNVGCCDVGGCAEAIAVVLILAVIAVASWVLVELVIPAIFFAAYVLVRGALARVANDEHGCEGDVVKSMGWGTLWATVYVLPLAALVWLVHAAFHWVQR
jgi:hypothetical protein